MSHQRMPFVRGLLRAFLAALLALAGLNLAANADQFDAVEELGQQIFTRGEGEGGREITVVLGEAGAELSAAMMPCSSCHGTDGRGRAEGGLSPSDVTWPALTRPYRTTTASGRRPAPYDAYLVKRAITMGLDSAGQPLHVAMPRYQLTHGEAAALVAYLRRLGELRDPGIEDDSIRLGVVLPPAGTLSSLGGAVRAVLGAAAERVNQAGGLYSRRLELRFLEPSGGRREAVERFLEDEGLFALVACFLVGAEAEVAEVVRQRRVPLVGPFANYPQLAFPLNQEIFYLTAGLPQQARALVDSAHRPDGVEHRRLVLHSEGGDWRDVVAAIRQQGEQLGGPWDILTYPTGQPDALTTAVATAHDGEVDTVFFLGSENETAAFLQAAGAHSWSPQVLLLGSLASRGALYAPESLRGRVFLAFPTIASDVDPQGFARYQQLRATHHLPAEHVGGQLAALAAFEVLAEALERAGRELSRERLIAALEGLYQFETALTPPLTYGPNRRIGALGTYVVTPDFERRQLLGQRVWVSLRE